MPDRMPDWMPEDMSDRVPEDMPDRMAEDLPDRMPEDMPEDMPDHMPEDMPDRMPNRMSEDMSDRMPEDLPVRKCINVMVGITRSKVIFSYRIDSDSNPMVLPGVGDFQTNPVGFFNPPNQVNIGELWWPFYYGTWWYMMINHWISENPNYRIALSVDRKNINI